MVDVSGPDVSGPEVGLFGVAGAVLLLEGLNQLVLGVVGAGQFLSGGVVSLAVALSFLVSLHRTLARRAATVGL